MTFVLVIVLFVVVIIVRRVVLNRCMDKETSTTAVAVNPTGADGNIDEKLPTKLLVKEDISAFEKFAYQFDEMLRRGFEFWARSVVCRFPVTTIILSLAWSIGLSLGMMHIEFTTGRL